MSFSRPELTESTPLLKKQLADRAKKTEEDNQRKAQLQKEKEEKLAKQIEDKQSNLKVFEDFYTAYITPYENNNCSDEEKAHNDENQNNFILDKELATNLKPILEQMSEPAYTNNVSNALIFWDAQALLAIGKLHEAVTPENINALTFAIDNIERESQSLGQTSCLSPVAKLMLGHILGWIILTASLYALYTAIKQQESSGNQNGPLAACSLIGMMVSLALIAGTAGMCKIDERQDRWNRNKSREETSSKFISKLHFIEERAKQRLDNPKDNAQPELPSYESIYQGP